MPENGKIRAIAKLYEYLSEFSERDLRAASEMRASLPGFTEALRLLARARRELDGGEKSVPIRHRLSETVIAERAVARPVQISRDESPNTRKLLQRAILDKRYFSSNQDIVAFFARYGVPLRLAQKDSRARALKRVENIYPKLNSAVQQRIGSALNRMMDRNQTSGWFSVIRGEG